MKAQLIQLMSYYGLTATRFSDEIGVQRSSISHIISGRNQPSYDFIMKIINKFKDINIEWLITGKGEMIKSVKDNTKALQTEIFTEVNKNEKQKELNHTIKKDNKNSNIRKEHDVNKKFTNVNIIERIAIFYDDGTFKEYKPRQHNE